MGRVLVSVSAAALLASAGAALAAPALPTGGNVTAGSASISSSGSSLTISQSSSKAIIDWQGFSIGQGGSVQFDNGSGATLNRVTGTSVSSIDGLLSATGSVYLLNPNGVIVGKSGVVNVGGTFVASTLDIPDSNFLAGGDLTASGPSTASVINEGRIGSLGGDVVLIAANVSNSGSLSAPNGAAGLLAGQSVLLRDEALSSGKFAVLVGGPSTSVTNSGSVKAANAELRANGGNIYALAGDTAGIIQATGVQQGDGHVWLIAEGGALGLAGAISARGPGGSGGTIETSGGTVSIGQVSVDAGVGGTWLLDPYDLTITKGSASIIDNALDAGTNVTEQTTATGASGYGTRNASGNGDIFVDAPLSWSTGATLTLNAWRNITVEAPITATGAGKVVLTTGSGGALGFGLTQSGFAGSLSFAGAEGSGQALTINGTPYTLIYSMAELAGLNNGSGHDALAVSLTPTSTYHDAVVKTFNGTLEGLGHTINGLDITQTASPSLFFTGPGNDLGLIGTLGSAGTVDDLGVVGGLVRVFNGADNSVSGYVGDLVGDSSGSINRSYATGSVKIDDGLLASMAIGGLVGQSTGPIAWSFATGDVTVGAAINSTTEIGGLVGAAGSPGSISDSFAAGNVTANTGHYSQGVGGLVGSDTGAISRSYATGAVLGQVQVGGLIGGSGTGLGGVGEVFTDDYATGFVQGVSAVGGLVGAAYKDEFDTSFSTGLVTFSQSGGGFIGQDQCCLTLSNDYWNTQTSGQPFATQGGGSLAGVTGQTTSQLQSGLPVGFDPSVWGQIAGVSYPYLLNWFPTTPEVISGTVTGKGVTPGYVVSAIVNGSANLGSTSTGADDTFYFLEPAGTLPQNSTAIVYLDGEPQKGAQAVEGINAGSSLTGLYFTSGAAVISTHDTTLSAMIADLAKGLGPATDAAGADILFGVSGSSLTLASQATTLDILPGGTSFVFNRDLDLGSSRTLGMVNYDGTITQSAGSITVGKLEGQSTGGLALTDGTNQIGRVLGWSDPSGPISITNGGELIVTGAVTAAGAVSLTTTSGDLDLLGGATVQGSDVTFSSAGKVFEGASSTVQTSGTLSVTGVGGLLLKQGNVAGSVELQNTGGGPIAYTEAGDLDLASASNAGGGAIMLTASPSGGQAGAITLAGLASGGRVALTAGGGISETGSGALDSMVLTGQAMGAVTLNGANMIGRFSSFTDTAGAFSLTDGETLTIPQGTTLDGSGQTVSLTTTAGDIAVNGTVKASTLNLLSNAGALKESVTPGAIIAGTLNATADTGITLASPNNQITTVGSDTTASGPNKITK